MAPNRSRNVPFCLADYDSVEKAMPATTPRIYCFGDSLTERAFYQQTRGFGSRLREYYEGRAVGVVNRGVSGFTSRWLVNFFNERIIQEAPRHPTPPLLITIFLGANDACLPPSSAHVPLPEFETHVRHYVDTILNDPATKGARVLLITPPPINVRTPKVEEGWESEIPAVKEALKREIVEDRGYMTWCSKRDYARRIVELGEEYAEKSGLVGVLDCWARLAEFGRDEAWKTGKAVERGDDGTELIAGCGLPGSPEFDEDFFVDGLHFGPKGYEVLSGHLIEYVIDKWPELRRENLPLTVD